MTEARLWAVRVISAALVVAFATIPTTAAHAEGLPSIATPANGTVVDPNWDGVVEIDFTSVEPETGWFVSGSCYDPESGNLESGFDDYYFTPETPEIAAFQWDGPIGRGFECSIDVSGDTGGSTSSQFTVDSGEPFEITSLKSSYSTFYPVIRDGYRDQVGILAKTTAITHHAYWEVYREDGSLLRRVYKTSNPGYWQWDGLYPGSGAPVRPGTYVIKLRAWGYSGYDSAAIKVIVFTGYVSKTYRKYKAGSDGRFSTSGPCYISRYDGSADFDSWGGTCVGNYYLAVPSAAYNVYGSAIGQFGDSDLCCEGSVTRTYKRTSNTVVRVTVKVNGKRAWIVDSAYVRYALKAKV